MLQEKVPDLSPGVGVNSGRGFIEDDGTRVSDERQQNGELPLHTSREVLRILGHVREKIDLVKPPAQRREGRWRECSKCIFISLSLLHLLWYLFLDLLPAESLQLAIEQQVLLNSQAVAWHSHTTCYILYNSM